MGFLGIITGFPGFQLDFLQKNNTIEVVIDKEKRKKALESETRRSDHTYKHTSRRSDDEEKAVKGCENRKDIFMMDIIKYLGVVLDPRVHFGVEIGAQKMRNGSQKKYALFENVDV